MKDYENEIDILDEGIERFKSAKWNASKFITRRDTAIKALLKMIEVEKVSREKSEAKKKKNEERENNLKEKKNQPIGKAIIQLDDEGNVIAEYQTVTEAASTVGISTKSIRDAAKGIQKHAAGFCWKYKEDNG